MIRFLSQRCNFVGAQNSTDYKTFYTLHTSILILALQSSDPFVREFLLLPIITVVFSLLLSHQLSKRSNTI